MAINDSSHRRSEGERPDPFREILRGDSPRNLGANEFTADQRKFWQSVFSHYDSVKAATPSAARAARHEIQHAAPAVESTRHGVGIPAGTRQPDLSGWERFFSGNFSRGEQPRQADKADHGRAVAPRSELPAAQHARRDSQPGHSQPRHGSIGGTMSWYGEPQGMANGHRFNKYAYTVAHKTLPLGTVIDIHAHGKTIRAEVTDRGPYYGNRSLDVSYAIARDIGFLNKGVTDYSATVVSTPNYYNSHHRRRHYA